MTAPSTSAPLRPLLRRRLRAAPAYRLVAHERLAPEQQAYFAALTKDPTHYGVLLPDAPGRPIKAVCCDTALLWHSLREPGPLPHYVRAQHGDEALASVASMVLDGILEVEGDDGFVGGPPARALLYTDDEAAIAPALDRVARLSRAALRYAQSLPLDDVHALAMRLYHFNAVPVGPRWLSRWGSADAFDAILGPAALAAFRPLRDPDTQEYWRMFAHQRPEPGERASAGTHKLYVSPHPRALAAALPRIVAVFSDMRVAQFKIGVGAAGLLRPDKVVAYFADRAALDAVAARLASELAGVEPQGVPFSAAVTEDGLLSWGVDPPGDAALEGWHGRESWRLWIVRRLALSLLAARGQAPAGIEPWQYALERVRLEGVDPATWTPTAQWTKGAP